LLKFPLVRLILALLSIIIPYAAIVVPLNMFVTDKLLRRLSALVLTAVVLLAYRAYVRIIEKRPVTELSRPGSARELGAGVAIGAMLFCLTIGIIAALGGFHVSGINGWIPLITAVPSFILAAVLEEIVIRGVVFRILELWLGSWIALAFSAVLFGGLHLFNPGANLQSGAAIMLEAGILLAAAYLLTRRLWFCMGIHFAWNFTQGSIFSVAVSGQATSGLLQSNMTGPTWLTGGAFGAEASVIAVIICTLAGLIFLRVAHRMGHFMRPAWAKAP
jgi:membrane protease YdiL (CAAX protease family)